MSGQNDLLSYLLELKTKRNLSRFELVAHMLTLFTDMYETSSVAIAHCLYQLAANADVQHKLRQEIIDRTGRSTDGQIDFDSLLDMEYLDQVFNGKPLSCVPTRMSFNNYFPVRVCAETLRLYPVFGYMTKRCTRQIDLTDQQHNKVTIDKGAVVIIPIYSIQRDPKMYAEPEKFDPERFSLKNGGVRKYRESGAFLPFSDGPRQCLGKQIVYNDSTRGVGLNDC